ncbi:FAD-binding oxidoreductase [bacterium]|nr:MAG: FAD-binding oxidoreductase [bacterium]
MKVAIGQLAAKLEAALGSGAVESSSRTLASYNVDGKIPSILLTPHDPEQIGAALSISAEAEASVIPWGGGTAMQMGNIPRQTDVIIRLERLDKLIEHDDANLTASVQAGIKVTALQKILGQRSQFLALEPPCPGLATIGGTVAANINGARRMLHGGVRDLVIGMKMVLATGEQIKAGGKVVKNVAGYDMCKLFVGSLGTLGVITEITFKLAPISESAATLLAFGPLSECLRLVDELSQSTLLPAAIAILSSDLSKATSTAPEMPAIAVWTEGFEEAVARHLRELQELAGRIGLTAEILRGEAHQRLWEHVRDFGANGKNIVYRMTIPPASVAEVVEKIDKGITAECPARYIAHAGCGAVWCSLDAVPSNAEWFSTLSVLAQEQRGHVVMVAAPPAFKEGIDVWGSPPPSLAIMREIKHQFDPQGILNPGRFIARL